MSERTFGVEVECGTPFDRDSLRETQEFLRINGFPEWGRRIGYDGTEIEIKSPILQGKDGFDELQAFYRLLARNDFYTTGEDGMHVHHGAEEFRDNMDAVKRLVKSWVANKGIIDMMVSNRRRYDYDCCPGWSEEDLEVLERSKNIDELYGNTYNDREDLNVKALRRHGTIEIRLHEGTLNHQIAEAWIKFGQRFIEDSLNRVNPLKSADTLEQLFALIRNSKTSSLALTAKVNEGRLDAR